MNWAVVHCFFLIIYIHICSKKECFICFWSWFWVCFIVPVYWFPTQPVLYIKHFNTCLFCLLLTRDCNFCITRLNLQPFSLSSSAHLPPAAHSEAADVHRAFILEAAGSKSRLQLDDAPVLSLSRVTWLPESLKWCMRKYSYEEIKQSLSELSTSCRSFMSHYLAR